MLSKPRSSSYLPLLCPCMMLSSSSSDHYLPVANLRHQIFNAVAMIFPISFIHMHVHKANMQIPHHPYRTSLNPPDPLAHFH